MNPWPDFEDISCVKGRNPTPMPTILDLMSEEYEI
jgi:hypothetical protein